MQLPAPRLCEVCVKLFNNIRSTPAGTWTGTKPVAFGHPELTDTWGGSHHIFPGSFVKAFKSKCYVCSTIFRDCTIAQRAQAGSFRIFYLIYKLKDQDTLSKSPKYGLDFTIEIARTDGDVMKELVFECTGVFKILPYTDLSQYVNSAELSPDTSGKQCEGQVRKWLTDCVSSHRHCQINLAKSRFYPSRLVNISHEEFFRVQDCKKEAPTGHYATLSYRWPEEMTTKLSHDTINKLEDKCEISKLSRTFQEAIRIARWMDIDYLWIDALCIVQDSTEDWKGESAKMGDIYIHSYCTISATAASGKPGCFSNREVSMIAPCRIAAPHSEKTDQYIVAYDDFWSNSLLDTTLHTRAWVVQERLLSPRNVHFGQEQIFWECRSQMACETYPEQIPDQLVNLRTQSWRLFDELLLVDAAECNPEDKSRSSKAALAYGVWSKTCQQYMTCKLSFPSDKLFAIEGIAQKVAETTGERYLAGLWDNEDLPLQLLWHVLGRRQSDNSLSYRSRPFRAPTWSWASLEAEILWNWPTCYDNILIHIENVNIEGAGNAMGEVSLAELHLTGCLLPATINIANTDSNGIPDENGNYDIWIPYEEAMDDSEEFVLVQQCISGPVIHLDTPLCAIAKLDIYCLPICTNWAGGPGGIRYRLAGLLLEQDPDPDGRFRGQYRRIGLFGFNESESCDLCGLDICESRRIEEVLGPSLRQLITII